MPLVPPEILIGDQGKQRTVSLVKEFPSMGGVDPIFTVKPQGKEGLINLRQLFIDMVVSDPTEVEFAEFVFGDYSYWEVMSESSQMVPHVREWRKVADTKRKTQAFKALIEDAKKGGVASAKYLIEEPWKPKNTRPAKKTSQYTTTQAYSAVASDVQRLRDEGLIQ